MHPPMQYQLQKAAAVSNLVSKFGTHTWLKTMPVLRLIIQYRRSPDAHVVLFQSADELGRLAAVLLDRPHHSGSLGVQVQARLWAPHLKGDIGHLYVGRQHALCPLCQPPCIAASTLDIIFCSNKTHRAANFFGSSYSWCGVEGDVW